MQAYIALIRKEEGTSYGVEFPDFPGCITAGETLEVALRRAPEALALHIEGMVEDGETIPEPSPLNGVMKDRESHGTVAVMVQPHFTLDK
jgi:predicted RNase H-like HicB family nuclease